MKYVLKIGYPDRIVTSKVKDNYKKLPSIFDCTIEKIKFKKPKYPESVLVIGYITIDTTKSELDIKELLNEIQAGKYSHIFNGANEYDSFPPNYTGYEDESIKPISAKEALAEAFNLETKPLTEALKITRSQVYHTKFGEFIIETKEGKARRRDYMTGKMAWKQVKYINGYFVDQPDFAKFYVEVDGQDKYVTCSEGNNSYDWLDSLGVDDFGDAVEMLDSEVVKCFQHYYKDDSIR